MSVLRCFFFIDAMGTEVIRNRPEITEVAPHVSSLRSVLGYSSACVPSILSGRLPQDHLHWSYFTHGSFIKPLKVPWWIQAMPAGLRDRGRVRRHLSAAVGRRNDIKGYFQMYMMPIDQIEKYGHCNLKIFLPPRYE